MKLLSAISFIFALSASTLAQADGFDFKGIALGSSVEMIKEKYPTYDCRARAPLDSLIGDKFCIRSLVDPEPQTFAGVPATFIMHFYEDKFGMASTTFAPSDFAQVTAALREKYGKPSSIKTEPVTNRMGATFENQILEWKKSGTAIRAEKYTSSLARSSVRIFSDSYDAELKKRSDAKRAQGAKDL